MQQMRDEGQRLCIRVFLFPGNRDVDRGKHIVGAAFQQRVFYVDVGIGEGAAAFLEHAHGPFATQFARDFQEFEACRFGIARFVPQDHDGAIQQQVNRRQRLRVWRRARLQAVFRAAVA
ncbi:hypothetical protein D3C81_1977590 [compost metagenome]